MKGKKTIKKIVFIIVDTTRVKSTGIIKKKDSPTPNIDKFSKNAFVFSNCYTTITKTEPSITAIMSGRYPSSLGFVSHGKWMDPSAEKNIKKIPLLAEILNKAGFDTIAMDWISRWHSRGFNHYSGKIIKDVDLKSILDDTIFPIKPLRYLDLIAIKIIKRDFFSRFYYLLAKNPKIPYDPADTITDYAIEKLTKNKNEKVFLYIHYRDPHFPYINPKGLKSVLRDSTEKRYTNEIRFMDSEIGRIFDYLKKKGLMEETLLIITADHGESIKEHGIIMAHKGLYDEVVRVPLIIYHPLYKGEELKSLVQNIDIFPTIMEALSIKGYSSIDGVSLLPLFSKKKKKVRDMAFFEDISFSEKVFKKSWRKRGIRFDGFKYIQTLRGKNEDIGAIFPNDNVSLDEEELFNVEKDKNENNNLVLKDKKIAQEAKGKLERFMKKLRIS